jgi:hypothetical protein
MLFYSICAALLKVAKAKSRYYHGSIAAVTVIFEKKLTIVHQLLHNIFGLISTQYWASAWNPY